LLKAVSCVQGLKSAVVVQRNWKLTRLKLRGRGKPEKKGTN